MDGSSGFKLTHLHDDPRSGQGPQAACRRKDGASYIWVYVETPVLPCLCFSPHTKQPGQKSSAFKEITFLSTF